MNKFINNNNNNTTKKKLNISKQLKTLNKKILNVKTPDPLLKPPLNMV